jgi:hypothetical protein
MGTTTEPQRLCKAELLIVRVPKKNKVYPVMPRTIYPNYGLRALEEGGEIVTDETLGERLEIQSRNHMVTFNTGEALGPIDLYD